MPKILTPLRSEDLVEKWGESPVRRRKSPPQKLMVCLVDGQKCAKILLTRGLVTIVDIEDAEMTNQFLWYSKRNSSGIYAFSKTVKDYLHRFIMGVIGSDKEVDHRNGNRLDNRRKNLRICTRSQNSRNQRKRFKKCTSRFKGVTWHREARKWQTMICFRRKRMYLGMFSSEISAARTYDAAAVKFHGEFARLNFPTL